LRGKSRKTRKGEREREGDWRERKRDHKLSDAISGSNLKSK
jgi:hypothetical protein